MTKPNRLAIAPMLVATALLLDGCGGGSDTPASTPPPVADVPIIPPVVVVDPAVEVTFPTGLAVGSPAEVSATAAVAARLRDQDTRRYALDFRRATWGALKRGDLRQLVQLAGELIPISNAHAAVAHQLELQASADLVEDVLSGDASIELGTVLDFQKLFAVASNAQCYGPSLAYASHENASPPGSAAGTLPGGDLGLWLKYESGTEPCVTAQLNRRVRGIKAQSMQGLFMMAAMRRVVAASATLDMPAASASTDLSVEFATLLHGYAAFAEFNVSAATISRDADSTYTYRLALDNDLAGAGAKLSEIIMIHTPGASSAAFTGVMQIAAFSLSADAAMGCSDLIDSATGMYKVASIGTLKYDRAGTTMSFNSRSGNYCGHPTSTTGTAHGAEVAAYTAAGELNPAISLPTKVRGSTKGWVGNFSRFAADFELDSIEGDFIYAWQAGPQDANSRMLAMHAAYNTVTEIRTVQGFFGYAADISTTDGSLAGMICNWAGPGNSHATVSKFQSQTAELAAAATDFIIPAGGSKITFAPTNNCDSTTTQFDVDVSQTLEPVEGVGTVNDLDLPAGANTVQQEIQARGFVSPALY